VASWSRTKRASTALFLAVLVAGPAFADVPPESPESPESAESLFVRARAAMKSGDFTTALSLLEQSHALEPALGTRFNLAICEARVGRLVQAAEHLRSVVEASAPGDARRNHAESALSELVPRIPRLIIEIDSKSQTLERVALDGAPLDGLRANEPFPINPGGHELEVALSNQAAQSRRFTVAERQVYTWSLGGIASANAPQPMPPDDGAEKDDSRHEPAREEPPSVWTTQRKAAVIVGGASLVAFGVGTGFALSARSIYDTSESNCPSGDICDAEGVEERDRARKHGNVATVAVTVGVSAAIAAGVLWFTGGPRAPAPAPPLRVDLTWERSGSRTSRVGVVVEGSY
jgi:hypothetical protein